MKQRWKNRKDDNQVLLCVVLSLKMYILCIFMRFSTIFTALFYPHIAHEQTAQNLDFVSSLVALILIECHRSQNKGSLKSEDRLSDFKERCAQL